MIFQTRNLRNSMIHGTRSSIPPSQKLNFLPATSSLFSVQYEYRSDSFLHLLEQIKMRRSGYLRRETVRIPPTSVRSKDHSEIEISKIRISAPETGAPFGVGRLWHHAHGTWGILLDVFHRAGMELATWDTVGASTAPISERSQSMIFEDRVPWINLITLFGGGLYLLVL